MATALGRSASQAAGTATPAKTGAAAAANAQPATSSPTGDAVAWIAQVMMPPATAPTKAPVTGQDPAAGAGIGAIASAPAATKSAAAAATAVAEETADAGAAPDAATLPALSAAQTAAAGAAAIRRGRSDTLPLAGGQAGIPAAAGTDAAATPAGGQTAASGKANALADVQALISGLSAPAAALAVDDTASAGTTTHGATPAAASDAAPGAAALQASPLGGSGATGTVTLTIKAAVGSSAFAAEVGSRVTAVAQSGITQAQLQLNPADLGPVQVHITMQSGQASVWFGATHADTRAALEQALPRLRELFAGAGMSLSDSGVFREPPQQQQAQSSAAASASPIPSVDTTASAAVTQVTNVRLALLDTYA